MDEQYRKDRNALFISLGIITGLVMAAIYLWVQEPGAISFFVSGSAC